PARGRSCVPPRARRTGGPDGLRRARPRGARRRPRFAARGRAAEPDVGRARRERPANRRRRLLRPAQDRARHLDAPDRAGALIEVLSAAPLRRALLPGRAPNRFRRRATSFSTVSCIANQRNAATAQRLGTTP